MQPSYFIRRRRRRLRRHSTYNKIPKRHWTPKLTFSLAHTLHILQGGIRRWIASSQPSTDAQSQREPRLNAARQLVASQPGRQADNQHKSIHHHTEPVQSVSRSQCHPSIHPYFASWCIWNVVELDAMYGKRNASIASQKKLAFDTKCEYAAYSHYVCATFVHTHTPERSYQRTSKMSVIERLTAKKVDRQDKTDGRAVRQTGIQTESLDEHTTIKVERNIGGKTLK